MILALGILLAVICLQMATVLCFGRWSDFAMQITAAAWAWRSSARSGMGSGWRAYSWSPRLKMAVAAQALFAVACEIALRRLHLDFGQVVRGPKFSEACYLILVTPFCEEMIFRQAIFMHFRRRTDARMAILGSAAAFGLWHWVSPRLISSVLVFYLEFLNHQAHFAWHADVRLWQALATFWVGLVLGYARQVSGSIVPGWVLHVAFNALFVLLHIVRA